MNILITGAAGFIGSHLCEKLLDRGDQVAGLDNFHDFYHPRIKRRNLRGPLAHPHFKLIEGDVRDARRLDAVLAEIPFDMIVHLAALAGVRPSINDPLGFADVNIRGTGMVLEAARKHRVKKFVFASSSSIYGNNIKVPFAETDPVDKPISPYAATKKAAELLCHTYHHLYGTDVTCLRYFTVYGPRQRPDLAIHKFARLIEAGEPIPVFGDGSMVRDFTYIDDIIEGTVAAMNLCAGYNIYNLGQSQPCRLDDLIRELEKALQKKAIIKQLPVPPGDLKQTHADITKAQTELGYNPQTSLPQGLARFVSWLRNET